MQSKQNNKKDCICSVQLLLQIGADKIWKISLLHFHSFSLSQLNSINSQAFASYWRVKYFHVNFTHDESFPNNLKNVQKHVLGIIKTPKFVSNLYQRARLKLALKKLQNHRERLQCRTERCSTGQKSKIIRVTKDNF